jgi:hypothetical protein
MSKAVQVDIQKSGVAVSFSKIVAGPPEVFLSGTRIRQRLARILSDTLIGVIGARNGTLHLQLAGLSGLRANRKRSVNS